MALGETVNDASATELTALMAKGEFTARELCTHFLERIGNLNPTLNAVITCSAETALKEAEWADQRRANGDCGALNGIPLLHKDIICTQGVATTCGSRMLEHFVPPYDATLVKKLRAAGTVSLGKTNMDEFAMGSSNETSYFGPARNPWDSQRVPGGSSGGSAAAVAAALAPVATGTDTGGSIRQPAAFCGVTGLKPTYGRVSRRGVIAYASSLDQAGPIARTIDDCALMLSAMAGVDPGDATSSDQAVPDFTTALGQTVKGLRIGLPRQYFSSDLNPAMARQVHTALEVLVSEGAELVDIDLPHSHEAIATYYVIAPAEASANLSRYDGVRFGHRCEHPKDLQDLYLRSRSEGFGEEVKRRILVGTYALSAGFYDAYFKKAQQVRRIINEEYRRALEQVDVIAGPTTPDVAFVLGANDADPLAMYMEDVYTLAVNLAGLPAVSLPAGHIDNLPAGLQLIGRPFDELTLIRAGSCLQRLTDWHRARPALAEIQR